MVLLWEWEGVRGCLLRMLNSTISILYWTQEEEEACSSFRLRGEDCKQQKKSGNLPCSKSMMAFTQANSAMSSCKLCSL